MPKEMNKRVTSGLTQLLTVLIVVLILISGFVGYLIGIQSPGLHEPPVSTSNALSSTKTITTTIPVVKLMTNTTYTTRSITVTSTSYQTTLTLDVNNSISSIAVANITIGQYPEQIAIDPDTNRIYVTFWNGSSYLAVIDGDTNKIIDILQLSSNSAPLVDSARNLIFVGNEIINGSVDSIVGHINSNYTFVALDEARNIVYADRSFALTGLNGTTILYEINGTTYQTIRSENYTGQILENLVFDNDTSMIFAADCTESFACAPSYVVSINGSSLDIESKLELDMIFFAAAFNPQTNMVYESALQNSLLVINGTDNKLITEIPVTAYSNEIEGITVDPLTNEIMLIGEPDCSGLIGCNSNDLYVLSATNYGLLATFVGTSAESGPAILQFDPANNETYVGFGFSNFVLAVTVPKYNVTMVLP